MPVDYQVLSFAAWDETAHTASTPNAYLVSDVNHISVLVLLRPDPYESSET